MPLTPDGYKSGVATWVQQGDPCCTPPVCYDPCDAACHLIWLLPSGPMWEAQKQTAIAKVQERNHPPFDLCRPLMDGCFESQCGGLADYAIFMAEYLGVVIDGSLWAAVRESNPFTAISTLDDWLGRFGWEDCYQSLCRESWQGQITPFEIEGECGPIYCPPPIPEDLGCAVKAGTVKALARMRMGFIPNLDGINWVIEPLGATVKAVQQAGDTDCCDLRFMVCPTDGTIAACHSGHCFDNTQPPRIPACLDISCVNEIGQPDVVWPGVITAECIVRTFLRPCPDPLVPCTEEGWQECSVVLPPEDWENLPPEPAFEECGVSPDRLGPINPNTLCGEYD